MQNKLLSILTMLVLTLCSAQAWGAAYTASVAGNWSNSATWGGAGVPANGDTVTINVPVTIDTNTTVGSGTSSTTPYSLALQSGGQITVPTGVTFSMNGTMNLDGTTAVKWTMASGSSFVMLGSYPIRYTKDVTFDFSAGTAISPINFSAAPTFFTNFAIGSSSSRFNMTANHVNFTRVGNSSNKAIVIKGDNITPTFNVLFTSCLFNSVGEIEAFSATNPLATVQFKIVNCDFRNPAALYQISHWGGTSGEIFNAGTRVISGNTFYTPTVAIRARSTNATNTNPIIISGNVFKGQSIMLHQPATFSSNLILGDGSNGTTAGVSFDNAATVTLTDNVYWANYANSHLFGTTGSGTHTGIVNMTGNVSLAESTSSADTSNHILYAEGGNAAWNISQHIAFGHEGLIGRNSTFTNTVTVDRMSHIIGASSISDASSIIEVADLGTTAHVIHRSCLYYNATGSGSYHNNFTYNIQDSNPMWFYLDYNNIYGGVFANRYQPNPAISGGTLGTNGYGLHDLNVDPGLANPNATMLTFDTAQGGAGTYADLAAQAVKLNGIDASGSAATFNSNFGVVNALAYFRAAATPTSASLHNAGFGGVDIGAVAVASGPVNGVCGNSGSYDTLTSGTSGNCTTGTVTSFSGSGPWSWYCAGSNSGTDSGTCTASINQYAVTPSAGSNGTLSPGSVVNVNYGATAAFAVTPSTCYSINTVTGCGGSLSGNTYSTGSITGTCTVTASFVSSGASYTVTPSAGANGSISPNSPQSVSCGNVFSYTVTPLTNFFASVSGTCGGSLTGNTYTTNPILSNCSVSAMFVTSAVIKNLFKDFSFVFAF